MKLKLYFLFGLILTLNCSVFAQEPEWFKNIKNIVVMSSTREDVTKLFGQPENSNSQYFKYYDLKEGKLSVEYSRGLCSDEKKEGWNVPEFTVTRIFFDFYKPVNSKKLPIDSTGFRKYPIKDVSGAFIYESDEKGIDYSVTSEGKIESITFYPSNKYDHLFCEKESK